MTSAARRLVLVRHGSAAPAGAEGDEARQLTSVGFDEARALGRWLKENDLLGDAVVCSPAMRTRQTWAAIDEETAHGLLIEMHEEIYEAGVEDLLFLVRQTDPATRTLVLVGHAPGVPGFAAQACDGAGDPAAFDELNRGFPPASCTVVSFDGEWAHVAFGAGHLDAARPGTL